MAAQAAKAQKHQLEVQVERKTIGQAWAGLELLRVHLKGFPPDE